MKYYKITIDDIQTASDAGLVACWNDEFNCSIVAYNDLSAVVFGTHEIIEINDPESLNEN